MDLKRPRNLHFGTNAYRDIYEVIADINVFMYREAAIYTAYETLDVVDGHYLYVMIRNGTEQHFFARASRPRI